MRPAKTQISLGIHPVWFEPSLCIQWVAKDPSFLHADSEDSDQTHINRIQNYYNDISSAVWGWKYKIDILISIKAFQFVRSALDDNKNGVQYQHRPHSFCLWFLFISLKISYWPSAGKDLSCWISACAVFLYPVLIFLSIFVCKQSYLQRKLSSQ